MCKNWPLKVKSFPFGSSLLLSAALCPLGAAAQSASSLDSASYADKTLVGAASYSSSNDFSEVNASSLPDAPNGAEGDQIREQRERIPSPGLRATRPFHSLAVGITLGSAGVGLQLATPLLPKFNLRTDASFFSYGTSFVVDTIPITGKLHLASVSGSLDWAPTGGNFHISPGITLYEDTDFNATIFIPGNQVIELNGQSYTSDPSDPIRGTAYVGFGKRVAPRLTVGYGNVIRHHTAGLTFPVEIGIEYIKRPVATFELTGSSCDSPTDCGPINSDPSTQQNIQEQQQEINSDIRPLRFFPIFSFGVSYKFGH